MNDINTANLAGTTPFPLATASLAELGLHAPAIDRLRALVKTHIVQGRYPGAQIALARHGKLALFETFGHATLEPKTLATDSTLWLLFSNTKVITAAGIWVLIEEGLVRFSDTIAEYIPEFARHGKGDITIAQVISPEHMIIRTWERGAGLTRACGSAACAAAVAGARTGRTDRAIKLTAPGGDLAVEWRADDHVILTGPAEWEFSGTFDPATGVSTRETESAA